MPSKEEVTLTSMYTLHCSETINAPQPSGALPFVEMISMVSRPLTSAAIDAVCSVTTRDVSWSFPCTKTKGCQQYIPVFPIITSGGDPPLHASLISYSDCIDRIALTTESARSYAVSAVGLSNSSMYLG